MSSTANPPYVKDAWNTPRNARTLRAFMAIRNQEIGQRLRELREARGKPPQPTVAYQIGVSPRALQTWEAGDSKPNWTSLQKLATYYGVSPEWILVGDETPTAPASQLDHIEDKLDRVIANQQNAIRLLLEALPGQPELQERVREALERVDPKPAPHKSGRGSRRRAS